MDGCLKENEGSRDLCIFYSVVLAYFCHHLSRESGTDRRLPDILWTTIFSETMIFFLMAGLYASFYEMCIQFCVQYFHLYPSLEEIPGGEPGRLFRLPPTVFDSI